MGAREAGNTFARVLIDAINASCSVSAWICKRNNEVMRIIRKRKRILILKDGLNLVYSLEWHSLTLISQFSPDVPGLQRQR